MEQTVTTARAAVIVGIGYEGLRSYLKRGLLGSSGILPPFVHPSAPAPDLSGVRATWKRFRFTDLCLMRLTKQLIDSGVSFESANDIASHDHTRRYFAENIDLSGAVLMAWPPYYDNTIFAGDQLQYLSDRLAEVGDIAILVQLDRIREHVRSELARTDSSAA